ncbi:hypothetical protein [Methanobrevibacter ruminantium]|nr:hypothetical protein [Methanobrevibacter ruminantium]
MGLEDSETDFNFMKADSKLNGSMINIAKFMCLFDYYKKRNY